MTWGRDIGYTYLAGLGVLNASDQELEMRLGIECRHLEDVSIEVIIMMKMMKQSVISAEISQNPGPGVPLGVRHDPLVRW